MGAVWLAERTLDESVVQRVVVKRPLPPANDGAHDLATAHRRFAHEARALARVTHGNIVRLLDAGRDAQGPWITLEHIDGLDAHALLAALDAMGGTRIDALEAAWVVHEAARGMDAAHALLDASGEPSPVLHRDLSPQNLLLSRHGEVKVTDFGIAWAVDRDARTTTGVVVGNLRYMAPEQLEGRALGPATDVYGLGRVLEEFLDRTAPSPCRDALRDVAVRATRRSPDERIPSMGALLDALHAAAPTLSAGRIPLATRVDALARTREHVHASLSLLLATERDSATQGLPAFELPAPHPRTAASPAHTPAPAPAPPSSSPSLLEAPSAARPALGASHTVAPQKKPRWRLAALALVPALALVVRVRSRVRPVEPAPTQVMVAPRPVVAQSAPPVAPAPIVAAPVVPVAPPTPRAPPAMEAHPSPRPPRPSVADAALAVTPTLRLATLRVSSIPFAYVTIDDGGPVGTPHAFEVTPGVHRVRARFETASGRVEVERSVDLAEGETRTLGLTPNVR